jgi:hypothetical protein
VQWALYKLGQYVEQKEDHLNLFMVGNEAAGHWEKVFGMDAPERILQSVERAVQASSASGASSGPAR